MKKKLVKISELVFDKALYPRFDVGWQTAYQYAQAMRSGSEFPPILVGVLNDIMYVVDGWHRVEAKKLLKEEHIQAIVKRFDDEAAMFVEAIKRNVKHGRQLSVREKVRLVYRLQKMDFTLDQVSEMVMVPIDKIEKFSERVMIGPNGEPVFLTSAVAKLDAKETDLLKVDMKKFNVRNVRQLLTQLIELLERNVYPFEEPEIKVLTVQLYGLLEKRLELIVAK